MDQRGGNSRLQVTASHATPSASAPASTRNLCVSSKLNIQHKNVTAPESGLSAEGGTAAVSEDLNYLRKESKTSVTQIRLQETFINVSSLEQNEDSQQTSEAWKRKRRKPSIIGFESSAYTKSKRVERLHHPLEENFTLLFVTNFLCALITVFICIPVSFLVLFLIPLSLLCKFVSLVCSGSQRWCCSSFGTNRLRAHDEQFFIHDNDAILQSIILIDGSLDLKRIRYILASRVIEAKTGAGNLMYPRLTETAVFLPTGPIWCHDSQFRLQNHVISGPNIPSEKALQKYVASLLNQPLRSSRPLWEIIVIHDFGKGHDTVMICRLHQSIADGMSLLKILCQSISDNQITHIPQKPHFGGATYGMNLFRVLFSGPLTAVAWLYSWCPDINLLTYKKIPPAFRHASISSSVANGTKVCCGCDKKSEANGRSSISSVRSEENGAYTLVNTGDPSSYFLTWGSSIPLNRIIRIKQVTRSCINEVFLSALSGSLRITLRKLGVVNPPDLKVNVAVDLRSHTLPFSPPKLGVKAALAPFSLPISVDGAVPRIWKLREGIDEMKSSTDAVAYYCLVWLAIRCLPRSWCVKLLDRVHSLASLQYSSLPGPTTSLLFGGYAVKSIYNVVPPRHPVGLSVTVFTYADKVHLTVLARKSLVHAKFLAREILVEMEKQCNQISNTLSHRRLPGEQRKGFVLTSSQIHSSRPLQDLQMSLARIQAELQSVTQQHDLEVRRGFHSSDQRRTVGEMCTIKSHSVKYQGHHDSNSNASEVYYGRNHSRSHSYHMGSEGGSYPPKETSRRRELSIRVQRLKEEFTELLSEIRRRKSVNEEGGISAHFPQTLPVEDEEAELRKPRKRALSVASVRSFVSLASVASRELNLHRDSFSSPSSSSIQPARSSINSSYDLNSPPGLTDPLEQSSHSEVVTEIT